ncbi:GMC oxidoreductase [Tulasnella calospora MUT 4182]|uniref:GMC oxidoreductase n=1 Tax=Tulasnella calospora MUT 4182 TaxID=1051891 RepID=A0A0C3QPT9_9AGAM|nr:GMC oxidoreductase [Tulasnella calospora MUT 4182]
MTVLSFRSVLWSCLGVSFLELAHAQLEQRGIVTSANDFAATNFDFVVVGGGTAGLAVAARLAEVGEWKIGVIEVGQYLPNDALINVPKNFGAAVGNANYDWLYATVAQTNLNGKVVRHPRGKVLGGSSAINFEMFNRPARGEFSGWSALNLGLGSWSWSGLLPYFKKSETYKPPRPEDVFPLASTTRRRAFQRRQNTTEAADAFFTAADSALGPTALNVDDLLAAASDGSDTVSKRDDAYHGSSGPVHASHNEWYSDLANPYILSMNSLGVATNFNPDSGENVGIYNCPASVDRDAGVRSYAAPAYYAPNAAKTNFLVLTGAQATKINWKSSDDNGLAVAESVSFIVNGVSYSAQASKEVILSGGVFNTPQLLELSGVGNPSILNPLGITTKINLPGVGENLQDHAMIPLSFTIKPGYHTWDELRNNATFAAQAAAQYAATKNGILASNIGVLSFFPLQSFLPTSKILSIVSTLVSDLVSSTSSMSLLQIAQSVLQLAWLSNQSIPQVEVVMIPGFNPTGTVTVPAAGTSYMILSAALQHPFSRGTVHITSTDPLTKPAIDPKYLSNAFDKTVLLEAVKYIRNTIATSAPISNFIATFNDPPASSTTDTQYEDYMKVALESLKHPVGTAAVAPKELGGVVSPQLLVHGSKNVRVVDASVFPMHISAHAQSTTYAIGEKAADIIKASW